MASNKRRSRARSASPVSDYSVVEIESPAKKAKLGTPSASTDYSWEPSGLQVGTHKDCRKVPIYAKLTRGAGTPVVLFKIDVPYANEVSKIQFYNQKINFDQIKFAPEFERGSAKETKEYIKSKFTKVLKPDLPVDEAGEEPAEDQDSSPDIGFGKREEPRTSRRKPPPLFARSPSAEPPSASATKTLSGLDDICSTFEEHVRAGFKTARDAVEDVVLNLEGGVDSLNRQLAEYKRRFGTLDNPLPRTKNNRPAKQPATPSSIPGNTSHLAMRSFENIAEGSNSGFMQEKRARRVNYNGNWYVERIIVEELQTYIVRGDFHGTTKINGRTFTKSMKESGGVKYLEMPSPGTDSIVTADGGRKFAKWTLLKPLNDPNDFVDELSESPPKTNSSYASEYR